jgi:hypothetical protein
MLAILTALAARSCCICLLPLPAAMTAQQVARVGTEIAQAYGEGPGGVSV